MNTNTMELSLNELEMISGGWSWKGFVDGIVGGGYFGACIGGGAAGVVTGPLGP